MMDKNPRLQRLRDFTVHIRDPENKITVGTGIAISDDQILTCAHVVDAVWTLKKDKTDRVGVYFPKFGARAAECHQAEVYCCHPNHDDDIVSLRLIDGIAPLGPDQFAKLGSAEKSEDNPFRSYGYSPTGGYPATRANGLIMGSVEPPEQKELLADPIQLSSTEIDRGMSGSAVLDTERNLVVGLVSERYFPKGWVKGNIAYAVDTLVLGLDPFSLNLQDEDQPKAPAPCPKVDMQAAWAGMAPKQPVLWNNAPPTLREWVGRNDLLSELTSDWVNSAVRITGLIGFGGEGKSSLARRWVENLRADKSLSQPDGVFWWGFYEKHNVDEFFEAALKYLSGGDDSLQREYSSTSAKSHLIAAMLTKGRYLFILDGLEVLQYQDGDLYGALRSQDLKAFLEFFSSPMHGSFCIITSRAPLMDLEEYTTYQHRDVGRLSLQDGRALLCRLGIEKKKELDRVVEDWDGHALTLSLLASYLRDHHGGDLPYVKDDSSPIVFDPGNEHVHRIMGSYNEHLLEAERVFLMIFSAFRMSVSREALSHVFRSRVEDEIVDESIFNMNDGTFNSMVDRLVDYRILRYDDQEQHYTEHPLIKAYYNSSLERANRARLAHKLMQAFYLDKSNDVPREPLLDDLKPLIEAAYHACSAHDFDSAWKIFRKRISPGPNFILSKKYGAYQIELDIIRGFFPKGDINEEPYVSMSYRKCKLLEHAGFCLLSHGSIEEATHLFERQIAASIEVNNFLSLSEGYQHLAKAYIYLGKLIYAERAANNGIEAANYLRDVKGKISKRKKLENKRNALCWLAWINHLMGNIELAEKYFSQAHTLHQQINGKNSYLDGLRGAQHTDHLIHIRKFRDALVINSKNIKSSEENLPQMSRSYRLEGDINYMRGRHDLAREQYNSALKIAQKIYIKSILIDALLARGRWLARENIDIHQAFSDLNEALECSLSAGYSFYEADIRIGLAFANIASGNEKKAEMEANQALRISSNMDYYWGKKDAKEALAKITH